MSEPSKTEKKIISHFLHKALQAVLASRIPHLSRPRHPRNPDRERDRDKWFSLALGDLPPALDTHAYPSPADPLLIDIILSPRDPASPEAVIERWTAACDPTPSPSASSDGPSSYRKAYRHCAVLIRSLCSLLRLLPAHRAFRTLSASNNSCNYDISYKVSSFAVPFTREEERELNLYSFVPVETQLGLLSLSVLYRPSLSGFDLELSSQAPPAIIADYVGSPAADPMRAFPDSLTDKGIRSTSYPLRTVRPSPPQVMARPHSWTSAPLAHHPLSASPGKTADLSTSPVDVYGNRASGGAAGAHRRGSSFGFDEFRLSPPFSASPTPSPPTHWSNPVQSRLRSETAPVSIPQSGMGKILLHRSPNLSDPNRSMLPPLSPRNTRGEHSSQESPSGSRSFRKSEGSRVGDFYSNLQWYTTQKAVIEHWTAACDPTPSPSASSDGPSSYRKAYRHCAVLIRSLCSLLRLLPAHRAFRTLSASNHSCNYDISYKVSSFAVPFTREEERELNLYSFVPVETQLGLLSLSVPYRPSLSGFDLELSSQAPPAIIADYVGNPAADPTRAFPDSLTDKGIRSTSYPLRTVRPSPPQVMARPHSWTSAPLAHHPLSASPGKTADLSTSPVDVYGNRASGGAAGAHRRGSSFGFDEFRLSPPFSASPTPSPAHWSNPVQSRLRSETAPVSIPQSGMGKILLHRSPNLSDPNRSMLPPLSPRNTRGEHSSQESPSGSRSFRKSEGSRVADFYSNLQWYTTQKMGLKDGRDDSGRFSSVLSSGGSPHFGISRSSSRLSIQDDLDDGDFSCPFAVDDVDTSYSQARNLEGKFVSESSPTSASSHNTGAAVGALVKLLSSAPPLRQDHSSTSFSSNSELGGEVGGSSFFSQRRASDALEELRNYREMKDMLLSQSGAQLLDSMNQTTR